MTLKLKNVAFSTFSSVQDSKLLWWPYGAVFNAKVSGLCSIFKGIKTLLSILRLQVLWHRGHLFVLFVQAEHNGVLIHDWGS